MMEKGNVVKIKDLKMVLKELLIPSPTAKELFNFKTEDSEKIFSGFTEFVGKESTETKKKLSI